VCNSFISNVAEGKIKKKNISITGETSLPSADSGIRLDELVDITCAMLDIPIYK
jgi:hypothetical protein